MIKVILESPFAGDVERNIKYARLCLKHSLSLGESPIASHLLYTQEGNLIVLMAVNKNKEAVFNILDLEGKIPEGFSVCWRNLEHIKSDLGN